MKVFIASGNSATASGTHWEKKRAFEIAMKCKLTVLFVWQIVALIIIGLSVQSIIFRMSLQSVIKLTSIPIQRHIICDWCLLARGRDQAANHARSTNSK